MLSSAPCLQKSEVQKSNENASVPKSNSLEANKQFKSILFCAPFERSAASNIMNRVVDFLTQNWDYGPEVCLAAFAFFHSARVRKMEKAGGKRLFWAESLVLTFFLTFGGGILAPFLLGKPPVMFVNDLIVPLVTFCWFLSHKADGIVFAFLDTPVVKQVVVVLAECFRANAICGMVMLSNATLKAGKDYPIPLWGPIFLGTIAGCGGLFMPLDKGLKGLKSGAPWPLQSAFYGSAFFNIFVFDPYIGPYLRNAAAGVLEGDPVIQGKAIVAAFFCSCAILQTYLGPSFNPFTPIHNILYMVTGVPTPAQVAATAASTEKAKED